MSFGNRARFYDGSADLGTILQKEMSGKYIERVQDEKPGEMLVMGKISNLMPMSSWASRTRIPAGDVGTIGANSEKVTTINGVVTMAIDSEETVAMNSRYR